MESSEVYLPRNRKEGSEDAYFCRNGIKQNLRSFSIYRRCEDCIRCEDDDDGIPQSGQLHLQHRQLYCLVVNGPATYALTGVEVGACQKPQLADFVPAAYWLSG